jgi:hypothetical protein
MKRRPSSADQRRQRVGQDLAEDDPAGAFAAQLRRLDEVHDVDVDGDGARQR